MLVRPARAATLRGTLDTPRKATLRARLPRCARRMPPAEGFPADDFRVTKKSWRGCYERILRFGGTSLVTCDPATMRVTNRFRRDDLL